MQCSQKVTPRWKLCVIKKRKKYKKEEALKSGNLLDLYDDEGNPLYETDTESDDSDSE